MKLTVNEHGDVELSEVFSGVSIRTSCGVFHLAERDGGLEIKLNDGAWYKWNDELGPHHLNYPLTRAQRDIEPEDAKVIAPLNYVGLPEELNSIKCTACGKGRKKAAVEGGVLPCDYCGAL